MSRKAGLECPWCNFIPTKNGKQFERIKTEKYHGKIERGFKCPVCGRSFKSVETSLKETYYKKELPITLDAGRS